MSRPGKGQVPAVAVPRLALYLRKLRELRAKGVERVSSKELAELIDLNPAQIRKDFSYFGEFGVRGVGYEVSRLVQEVGRCLGLTHSWNIVIIGAGQLGTALAWYRGFAQQGFRLIGVFDDSPRKVGARIGPGQVRDVAELEDFCRERLAAGDPVHIGVVTVPAAGAQETVDRLVGAGVRAILNFAPVRAVTPPGVFVRQVDLSSDLMFLSYFLNREEGRQ